MRSPAGRRPAWRHRQSCRIAALRGGTGRRGAVWTCFPACHRRKGGASVGPGAELLESAHDVGKPRAGPEDASAVPRSPTADVNDAIRVLPGPADRDPEVGQRRPTLTVGTEVELAGPGGGGDHRGDLLVADHALHAGNPVVPVS